MRFKEPLTPGRLVRRYKRFLADVELPDGAVVTVHCPNPGRMLGLDAPGSRVWLSRSPNAGRKLPHTLEIVEADGGLVGINTMHPNRLLEEALHIGAVEELQGYDRIRREVAYDHGCRIDLLLQAEERADCYVEVKNVHLKRARGAEFPDAITARGARHLQALARRVAAGERAVMMYVVQRMDCVDFSLADDIDPAYARAFEQAIEAGVEASCRACSVTLDHIHLGPRLPINL
ncbi:MAG TPA: DNA/RNA nuclease SfsA [Geminicoccaceae bacterium]